MLLNEFQYIRDISAEEVFDHWREREAGNPGWQQVAKDKGWPDWESWRRASFNFMKGGARQWKLYEIKDPNKSVPEFLVGPWPAWQKDFAEKNRHTFRDLVEVLAKENDYWAQKIAAMQKIRENFPQKTEMIGFYLKGEDNIVLFEGHHRCAAIAAAVADGQPIEFTKNPIIAIAILEPEERVLLDQKLERGTSAPNA